MKTFILTGGYRKTGSSALHSLLKELQGIHYYNNEFMLLAGPDGLIDLEDALVNSWSAWRSDLALKRFRALVNLLGRKKKKGFSLLALPGKNYNRKFTKNFTSISEKFINNLISLKYRGRWRGTKWNMSLPRWMLYRAQKNITGKKPDFEINLSFPKDRFLSLVKEYLNELLTDTLDTGNAKVHSVILDLATYHCCPERLLSYFEQAKMIVVDRDPRDNFVELKKDGLEKMDADNFISWYKIMRSQSYLYEENRSHILKINFEDLALNYDASLDKIYGFLGISPDSHQNKLKFFNPERASSKVGLWKEYPDRKAIQKIRDSLPKYCRP